MDKLIAVRWFIADIQKAFVSQFWCLYVGMKVQGYIRREHARPVLRFFLRTVIVVGAILLLDVLGLLTLLFCRGPWSLTSFVELLIILLFGEGSLIGVVGAFMFYGFSEYGIFGQSAINPAIARDQAKGWRERRLSQQEWGITMIIVGVLLILLGLLVSLYTPV